MKKLVQVAEVEDQGLESLLEEKVLLLCGNYFYSGRLIGVNDKYVLLDDAEIVYETGAWSDKAWKYAEKVSSPWRVATAAIESYGKGK